MQSHTLTLGKLYDLERERWKLEDVGQGQQRAVAYSWRPVLEHFGAGLPVGELSSKDVRAYIAARREVVKPSGKQICGSTIAREVQALKRGLQLAIDDELIPAHPVLAMRRVARWGNPSREEKSGKVHERSVLIAFLRELPEDVRAYYVVALLTGLRAGELMRLEPRNIDGGILNLRAEQTKTRQSAVIPLAEAAQRALISQCDGKASDEPIFPQTLVNYRQYQSRRACRVIGYDRTITARDMRHAHATAIVREADMATARDACRHASTTTTSRYVHGDPDARVHERVAAAMPELAELT
jgi:integrase